MKGLRDQLRPLPLKGKIEYLRDYYSFHFIAAIVVIIFLVVGIHSFINHPKELLAIRVIGTSVTDEQTKKLENNLDKLLVDPSKKEKLSVYGINTSEASGNSDSFGKIQKLQAEIAAKAVDVLLVDEETFQQFNKDGSLYDLRKVKGLKLNMGKTFVPQKNSSKITGIDVSDVSDFSPIVNQTDKPLILAVLANTERIKEIQKFVGVLNHKKM